MDQIDPRYMDDVVMTTYKIHLLLSVDYKFVLFVMGNVYYFCL